MGIHDRDYYRDDKSSIGQFAGPIRAYVVLLVIVIGVFLIQVATREISERGRLRTGDFTLALSLGDREVADGEVWRLITGPFLHDPFQILPIAFTVMILLFIGRSVEELRGSLEYGLYFLCTTWLAALASVGVCLLTNDIGILYGPLGGLSATIALYCLFDLRRTILLMFIVPAPAWVAMLLYVAMDVLGAFSIRGFHPSLLAGHIVAISFAMLYHRNHWHLSSIFGRRDARSKSLRVKPQLKIYRDETAPMPRIASVPTRGPETQDGDTDADEPSRSVVSGTIEDIDEHLEANLDRVLEKVEKFGQAGLTEQERAILFRASEIYRKRRK